MGSSSYVTDLDGEIFQHLEYFPFGETWVEEHSNTQRTPYLFTAKELDEETGLYYFGARYYDPRTSVWQSPDPILASYLPTPKTSSDEAMKLPSRGGVFEPANLSLYTYVQNRPVHFIDPNGEYTTEDAIASLRAEGVEPANGYYVNARTGVVVEVYSDAQIHGAWMQLEEANTGWREGIPACPSSVLPETGYRPEGAEAEWRDLKPVGRREGAYHPGAVYSMRSQPNEFGAGCQCIYDEQGRIVEQGDYTEVVGGAVQDRAGTMDRYSPNRTDPIGLWRHFRHDVEPYNRAGRLDRLDDYFRVRPMEVESDTQSTE